VANKIRVFHFSANGVAQSLHFLMGEIFTIFLDCTEQQRNHSEADQQGPQLAVISRSFIDNLIFLYDDILVGSGQHFFGDLLVGVEEPVGFAKVLFVFDGHLCLHPDEEVHGISEDGQQLLFNLSTTLITLNSALTFWVLLL
jgi:hypothetical protein